MNDNGFDFAVQDLNGHLEGGIDWAASEGDETVYLVLRLDENDGEDRSTHRMIAGFAADCFTTEKPDVAQKLRHWINQYEDGDNDN